MRTTLNISDSLLKETEALYNTKNRSKAVEEALSDAIRLKKLQNLKNTGIISLELRKKGITVPLTDVLIASVAMRCKMKIYTLDKHFPVIPGVTAYNATM